MRGLDDRGPLFETRLADEPGHRRHEAKVFVHFLSANFTHLGWRRKHATLFPTFARKQASETNGDVRGHIECQSHEKPVRGSTCSNSPFWQTGKADGGTHVEWLVNRPNYPKRRHPNQLLDLIYVLPPWPAIQSYLCTRWLY